MSHAVPECSCQASVRAEAEDVMDAILLRHFDRPVGAAIVHHEDFDGLDAFNLSREVAQCLGERQLLVEAWDLDDEFQAWSW